MATCLQRSEVEEPGATTVERADTRPAERVQTSQISKPSTTSELSEPSQQPDVGMEVAELVFLMGFLVGLVWLAGALL